VVARLASESSINVRTLSPLILLLALPVVAFEDMNNVPGNIVLLFGKPDWLVWRKRTTFVRKQIMKKIS